jgi:hypothetical protein
MFQLKFKLSTLLLHAIVLTTVVEASSSAADINICRADSDRLGCSSWANMTKTICPVNRGSMIIQECYEKIVPNRGKCLDEPANETIMSWTAKPVLSKAYSLRSGNGLDKSQDPTTYQPEKWMTITLKTLEHDKKYRGLLLHADDTSNIKVGEWGLPQVKECGFWHPPVCGPRTVLHSGASVKSYTNHFRFKGPKVGTGPITFKALVKVGAANTGEFYLVPSVTLQEQASSPSPNTKIYWTVGQPGLSCDQVCKDSGSGHLCDISAMKEGLSTREKFNKAMSAIYPCNDPLVFQCSANTLSTTEQMHQGRCLYSGKECNKFSSSTNPCAKNITTNRRRFCACKSIRRMLKSSATLTPSQEDTHDTSAITHQHQKAFEQEIKGAWEVGTLTVHGTSSEENLLPPEGNFLYNSLTGAIMRYHRVVSTTTIPPQSTSSAPRSISSASRSTSSASRSTSSAPRSTSSAPRSTSSAPRSSSTSLMLLFIQLLLCVYFMGEMVEAHNWIGTPRRGGGFSATPSIADTRPCSGRRPQDIHYQVGPDQKVAIKFSSGHSGRFLFMIIPGSEADWLRHPDIEDISQEYMKNAPAGSNTANVIGLRRIRDCAPDGTFRINTDKYSKGYLPKRINDEHAEWLEHPDFPNRETFIYSTEYIESARKGTDFRISYKSKRYPWLEAVYSYHIAAHNPADYDVVPLTIPGYHGSGHYIVWYHWRGYSGCIDVEYFDKPVPFPYGKPKGVDHEDYIKDGTIPFMYNSHDHCQFDTYDEVATTCMPAGNETKNAMEACVNLLDRDFKTGYIPGYVKPGYSPSYIVQNGDLKFDPLTYRFDKLVRGYEFLSMGIEATMISNPSNTIPNVVPHIPWDHSTCAIGSPLLTLNDNVEGIATRRSDALTEENIRDVSMFHGITELSNKKCTHHASIPKLKQTVAQMTLRNAMAMCSEIVCHGVEVTLPEKVSRKDIGRNESVLISVSFCSRSTTKDAVGKITFLKNKKTLNNMARYPIQQTTADPDKASFPGRRDGSGLGYQQLLKVGRIIKINFMPDRQPTCREVEHANSYPTNCYWCYRRTDCQGFPNSNYKGLLNYANQWYTGDVCQRDCGNYPNFNIDPNDTIAPSGNYSFYSFHLYGNFPNLVVQNGKNNGNFDIAKTSNLNPKDWAIDSGKIYGSRTQRSGYNGVPNLEYGWNCDVSKDGWIGQTIFLNSENIMNATHFKHMDVACKDKPDEAKIWKIKLPDGPGFYRVYIYAGKHSRYPGKATKGSAKRRSSAVGGVHGCTVENVRLGENWMHNDIRNDFLSHGIIEKIVFTKDDVLTFQGGKYCQAINWIMIEKVSSTTPASGECKMIRGRDTSASQTKVLQTSSTVEECALKVKNYPIDKPNDSRSPIGALRNIVSGQCYAVFELGQLKDDKWWTTCKFVDYLTPPILSSFDPVWLPSSSTDSGIIWEMEVASDGEDIGFVSLHTPGMKSIAGQEIGFGEWKCRSRWLWDGNFCQKKSVVNTGPYFKADSEICRFTAENSNNNCNTDISTMGNLLRMEFTTREPINASGTYTWNQDMDLHGGKFLGDGQGFVVSVADEPCDFTNPDNPLCPTAKKICGHARRPKMCPFNDYSYCPNSINCNGIHGRYVRVQLPGKQRILDAKVQVHRHRPKITDSTKSNMVCYGVKTRKRTSVREEFTSTKDMEDPKFYSSCYVREQFRSRWKTFPRNLPPGDYIFGDQCINCDSYLQGAKNLNLNGYLGERLSRWLPAPDCAECTIASSSTDIIVPDSGTGTGSSSGSGCSPTSKVGGSVEFISEDQLMNIKIHHHPGASESNKNFLDFQVTFQQSKGWFAIGVSETGGMTGGMSGGSDIISCEQAAGPMRYWATSRSTSWVSQGVKLTKTSPTTIEHSLVENTANLASCEFSNGKSTLNFRRLLTVEDNSATQREIKVGVKTHFIWAHGTTTKISYHGGNNRGSTSVIIPDVNSGCKGGDSGNSGNKGDDGNSDGNKGDDGSSDGNKGDDGNSDGNKGDDGSSDGNKGDDGSSDGNKGDGSSDSNEKDITVVLYSSIMVSGIVKTDLQDSETQQKLTAAIAGAVGVSPERVKITDMTDVGTYVQIKYHIQVKSAYASQVKEKMQTLDTNEGVKSTIANQVGIDVSTISVTPGEVTSSTNNVGDSQDKTESGTSSQSVDYTVLVLLSLLAALSLIVAALLFQRRRRTMALDKLDSPIKKAGVPAIAIEMPKKTGASKMEQNPLQIDVVETSVVESTSPSNTTDSYLTLGEVHRNSFKEGPPAVPLRVNIKKSPPSVPSRPGFKKANARSDKPPPIPKRQQSEEEKEKKVTTFDLAAAAPPEVRVHRSRLRIQRKNRPVPVPSTPTTPYAASSFSESLTKKSTVQCMTPMGPGTLLFERPNDHCRVFELSWKLAGDSKALLYSFKK